MSGLVDTLLGAAAQPGPDFDPIKEWGHNITKNVDRLEPAINRDAELKRIIQILARNTENNPLLVGESGVGKHAIINALAVGIAHRTVPGMLHSKQIIELDLSKAASGAQTKQKIEDNVRRFIAAAAQRNDVIVFLPSLTRLTGGMPAMFASAINRGEIRAIAIVRPDEIKKINDVDAHLLRRFVQLEIKQSSVDESIDILRGIVGRFETAHKVHVSDRAIISAVRFAKRYVQGASLPKAAINILDEACGVVRIERESAIPPALAEMVKRSAVIQSQIDHLTDDTDHDSVKRLVDLRREAVEIDAKLEPFRALMKTIQKHESDIARVSSDLEKISRGGPEGQKAALANKIESMKSSLRQMIENNEYRSAALRENRVLESDVAAVIAAQTGVPVSSMLEEETEKLKDMEKYIERRVVGQNSAVFAISKAVRRSRVGLRDPKKPIGSFLLLGPTGVGKTELAKSLAEFMFSSEDAMTRLDMSEFMEKHSVARLLGSPPGYADSEAGGFLTEAVRNRPYSVVLFDEMEKAHPDVFNILLQVLDDGRLTDSRGNLALFSDSVVILTSNVGSRNILDAPPGTSPEDIRAIVEAELRRQFRPEFLNRIDDIVIFNPLSKDNLRGVVDIQLKLSNKMLAERGITLEVSDAAKNKIVDMGYEPAMGARPVKRVILKQVQDPLTTALISGGYKPGDTVFMDIDVAGEFVFTKKN